MCKSCRKGYFGVKGGAATETSACKKCQPGYFNNLPGNVACTSCQPGYFTNYSQSITCKHCSRGRYRDSDTPATACTLCPVGKYGNSSGKTSCDLCPAGKYNNQIGAFDLLSCIPCAVGKYAGADGSKDCFECRPGTYHIGDTITPQCFECTRIQACIGGIRCAEGHEGILCSSCKTNYYKFENQCLKCPESYWPTLIGIAVIMMLLIILYFVGVNKATIVRLKLLTNFFQIAGFLAFIPIVWPAAARQLLMILYNVSSFVQIFHPSCYIGELTVFEKLFYVLLITILLFFLIRLFEWFFHKKQTHYEQARDEKYLQAKKFKHWKESVTSLRMLISLCVYAPVLQMCIPIFHCQELQPNKFFLRSESTTECFTPLHYLFLFVSIGLSVFVGVCFPLYTLYVIKSIQKKGLDKLDNPSNLLQYGALYYSYKHRRAWFETIVLFRKFIMLTIYAFIPQDKYVQSLSQLFVMFAYLLCLQIVRPFEMRVGSLCRISIKHTMHKLELFGTLVNTINYVIAMMLAAGVIDETNDVAGYTMVVLNVLVVSLMISKFEHGGMTFNTKVHPSKEFNDHIEVPEMIKDEVGKIPQFIDLKLKLAEINECINLNNIEKACEVANDIKKLRSSLLQIADENRNEQRILLNIPKMKAFTAFCKSLEVSVDGNLDQQGFDTECETFEEAIKSANFERQRFLNSLEFTKAREQQEMKGGLNTMCSDYINFLTRSRETAIDNAVGNSTNDDETHDRGRFAFIKHITSKINEQHTAIIPDSMKRSNNIQRKIGTQITVYSKLEGKYVGSLTSGTIDLKKKKTYIKELFDHQRQMIELLMSNESPFKMLRLCYCPSRECYREAEELCNKVREAIGAHGQEIIRDEVDIIESNMKEAYSIEKLIDDRDIHASTVNGKIELLSKATSDYDKDLANLEELEKYLSNIHQKLNYKLTKFINERKYRQAKYIVGLKLDIRPCPNATIGETNVFRLDQVVPS